jgi:hypothetical protein
MHMSTRISLSTYGKFKLGRDGDQQEQEQGADFMNSYGEKDDGSGIPLGNLPQR